MDNFFKSFWFRLIAVAFVSVFITELGSVDSLFKRLHTLDFYREYFATLIISLTIVEWIYTVNDRLEKNVPWHQQVFKRLMLQVLLGLLVPSLLVFALASVYFAIHGYNIFQTDYLVFGFPLVMVMIILLNILLVMLPYFLIGMRQLQGKPSSSSAIAAADDQQFADEPLPFSRIKAYNGNSVIMLVPEEVLAAYIVGGKVLLKSTEKAELLTDFTLDELEKEYLPTDSFFRINRQLILHRDMCKGFKSLDYGKLEVTTDANLPVNTVVSQLKAKGFKEWIG